MSRKSRKLKTWVVVVIAAAIILAIAFLIFKFVIQKNTGANSSSQAPSSSLVSSSSSSASSSSQGKVTALDTKPGSLLMLANKDNAIAKDWEPQLTTIAKSYYYADSKDNHFDTRAADHLKAFIDAGRKAGYSDLCILSGYRTYAYQQSNFDRHVKDYMAQGKTEEQAKEETAKIVAPAGTSEHETGLAADIITKSWYNKNGSLESHFDKTDACQWLLKNAANYGFILRYPEDKVAETGYSYESWHFRYVGVENAKKIAAKGYCLEDFIKNGGK